MFHLPTWLLGLIPIAALMVGTWVVSLRKRDVSIVDPIWSLTFVGALAAYWYGSPAVRGPRSTLIAILVLLWAVRLSAHLFVRGWGEPEDRRYVAMREGQGPTFPVKSLFTVFGVQMLLAWVVSLPLLGAVDGTNPLGWLDGAGVAAWLIGMTFQVGGDLQLTRFKRDTANAGRVLDTGFWRYTRHPNYFGEFCIWWGHGLVGVAAGAWWGLFGVLLITFLLLRVSGVPMLEEGMEERRPGYTAYVKRTNAFFPGPPRAA